MTHAEDRRKTLQSFVEKRWYSKPGVLLFLLPFEWLFRGLAYLRKRVQLLHQTTMPVPLIVVGNINVGGTGKTPVIKALVKGLQARGFKPGIVSRGYGRKMRGLHRLSEASLAEQSGDEPLEIFRHTGAAVAVSENRLEAAQALLDADACNILLSDDGLQHYRLPRHAEIVVVDSAKGFGNGHCLPVGPLREPQSRLKSVDCVLVSGNGGNASRAIPVEHSSVEVHASELVNVKTGAKKPLTFLPQLLTKTNEFYALAGIGEPEKFFQTLEQLVEPGQVSFSRIRFPDHYRYSGNDFSSFGNAVLLMTEKDAVKCQAFASDNWWYLAVEARLPAGLLDRLCNQLQLNAGTP